MSSTAQLSEILRGVLTQPAGGIVGLADDLLKICSDYSLQLECEADTWRFRTTGGSWEALTNVTLRKSVFRALLGRFAAVLNEHSSNAFSPYEGRGQISVGAGPGKVEVCFVNTSDVQRLELAAKPRASADGAQQKRAMEEYPQIGGVAAS